MCTPHKVFITMNLDERSNNDAVWVPDNYFCFAVPRGSHLGDRAMAILVTALDAGCPSPLYSEDSETAYKRIAEVRSHFHRL